ncbi:flagellar hook-length control protein FliK [Roseovarius sp. THAF9]|uniref:flagellar hook-length control protein FliK n=1 Tax=Roseovarius sp. THAF9 TaxID=2587847 RepID=UPI0020C7824C|nr:flagellar hook-length control protein FliK [Roseovarius sp. THAF9]
MIPDMVPEGDRPDGKSGPASFASIFAEGRSRPSPEVVPESLRPEADIAENAPDELGDSANDVAVDDGDEADTDALVARDSGRGPETRSILAQSEEGEIAKQDTPHRDGGPPTSVAPSIIAAPGDMGRDPSGQPDSALQETEAGHTTENRDVLQNSVPGRESTLQRNVSEPPALLWPEEPGRDGIADRAGVPSAMGAEASILLASQATKLAESDRHVSAASTAPVSGAISHPAASHYASRTSASVAEDVHSCAEIGATQQRDMDGARRISAEGQNVIAKSDTAQVATPARDAATAESIGTTQPAARAKSDAVIQGHSFLRPEATAPTDLQKQPSENSLTLPKPSAPEADMAKLLRPARLDNGPTTVTKFASPSSEGSATIVAVAQLAAERTALSVAGTARAGSDASIVRDAPTARTQNGQGIVQSGASPSVRQDMPQSETRVRPAAEPEVTSSSGKGPAGQSDGPKTPAAPMTTTPAMVSQIPGANRLGEEWSRGLEVDASRTSASGALTSQVETSAPLRPNAPMSALSPELPRHVAEQLASGFRSGADKSVEIRLNPVELGRVRINLQTGDTGVIVTVLADRPETLDLLRRHTDILAQEFQEIGYGAAEFSFDQGSDARSDQGSDEDRGSYHREGATLEVDSTGSAAPTNASTRIALDRVDIRL